MFIRYNETDQFWEYTNSGNASGPWTRLPVDASKLLNLPPPYTLPTNVALKDAANIFTRQQTIVKDASESYPAIFFDDISQPAGSRKFGLINSSQNFYIHTTDDAGTPTTAGIIRFDRAGNAVINGSYYERSREYPIGTWINVPFSAGNFIGGPGLTWTVEAADVSNFRYTLIGKTMVLTFAIVSSSTSGVANVLYIRIPGGFIPAFDTYVPITILDAGVRVVGYVVAITNNSALSVYRLDAANYSPSTNLTYILGQITFEIQ